MGNHGKQEQDLKNFVAGHFIEFMKKLKEDDRLSELEAYMPDYTDVSKNRWNIEKAKVVLEVLKSKNKNEVEKILSFLD